MCIVFWTIEAQNYALILCTNRDEYLQRPTRDASFHAFKHEAKPPGFVLSGIDELAGGTWFGLNRSGKIALLTNITEPPQSLDSSRGSLVSSFLLSASSDSLEDEVARIIPRETKFAGFNLLLLAPVKSSASTVLEFDASFVTNGGAGGIQTSRPLSPEERSCSGFSNGVDGKGGADWPKVKRGIRDFDSLLRDEISESELVDRLFDLLSWQSPDAVSERSQLRNTIQVNPIPIILGDAEPRYYGTRLSTVLLIRKNGQVLFVERDIWKMDHGKVSKGDPASDRVYQFPLEIVA
ncbi:NRDE protein-domain-containing protein [Mycena floridula]|nr:NRDE protein-domain-containing protein [Mycena floridula]